MIYIPSFVKTHLAIQKLIGDTQTHRLMGGIYELHFRDALVCHDIHTKFHRKLFSQSIFDKVDTKTESMEIA
jgi:hypothetical protein